MRLSSPFGVRFHHEVQGYASLNAFNFIYDTERSGEGCIGLGFDLVVEARDFNHAFEVSRQACVTPYHLLGLIGGIGLPDLKLVTSLSVDSASPEVEYVRFVHIPLEKGIDKEIEESDIGSMIGHMFRMESDREMDHLTRSIGWFVESLSENKVFVRFLMLCMALESLNRLLKNAVGFEKSKQSCPHCGKYTEFESATAGLRMFFSENLENGESLFKTMTRLRGSVVHGGGTLRKKKLRVREILPRLENAYCQAIGEILAIDSPLEICESPLNLRQEIVLFTRIKLEQELAKRIMAREPVPEVEPTVEDMFVQLSEDGFISVDARISFEPEILTYARNAGGITAGVTGRNIRARQIELVQKSSV